MEGLGKPQSQLVTPNIFGYSDRAPGHEAEREPRQGALAQAGFPNGFKVCSASPTTACPGDGAVGTAVSQMLARIGHRRAGGRRSPAP
jgi:peptide/nickel transport system substrate-binding protein